MSHALQYDGLPFRDCQDFLETGGIAEERGLRAMAYDMAYGREAFGLRLAAQLADSTYCRHWKQRIGRINTKRVLAIAEKISLPIAMKQAA